MKVSEVLSEGGGGGGGQLEVSGGQWGWHIRYIRYTTDGVSNIPLTHIRCATKITSHQSEILIARIIRPLAFSFQN